MANKFLKVSHTPPSETFTCKSYKYRSLYYESHFLVVDIVNRSSSRHSENTIRWALSSDPLRKSVNLTNITTVVTHKWTVKNT